VTRHPHVFGEETVENSDQVLDNWDKLKKKEQGLTSITEELRHIAKVLPGLMRAEKVQKKASKVGFDWNKVEDVFEKVSEELNEVKDVYNGNDKAKIQEEIGDLLFSVVNAARFLDIDSEVAVNYTTDKFIQRFEYIENYAVQNGVNLEDMTLHTMDKLWEEAKSKKNL
jgi:tetrapyrrole methylase family protein / MazG family protein